MQLETAQSLSYDDVTAEQVSLAFADDRGRGEFIILSQENGDFLQAAGEGDGPYVLEYRTDAEDKQLQCDGLSKQEVEAAFLDYLAGGVAWREQRAWRELELNSGCLGSLLLMQAAAASLFA